MSHFSSYNFILLLAASMAIMNKPAIARCPLANGANPSPGSSGPPGVSSGAGSAASRPSGLETNNRNKELDKRPSFERPGNDCGCNKCSLAKAADKTGMMSNSQQYSSQNGLKKNTVLGNMGTGHSSFGSNNGNFAFKNGNSRMGNEDDEPFSDEESQNFSKIGDSPSISQCGPSCNKACADHSTLDDSENYLSSETFKNNGNFKKFEPEGLQGDSHFAENGDSSLKTEKGSVAVTSENKGWLLQNKWIVYYYMPTCGHCLEYQSKWNQRVQSHRDKGFQYATVNCQTSPELCKGVHKVPALFEFNGGKKKPINQ